MSSENYQQPLRLKDFAVSDRPQERLARLGAPALSDTELLAMLLRSGQRGMNVVAISQKLVAEAGSLAGLTRWSEKDFRKVKGIGPVKSLQLLAVMEIARRVLATEGGLDPILNRPELIFSYFRPLVAGLMVEKFWTLCLSRKNRLIKLVEVSSGTATSCLAHPREVYREAIQQGSTGIVCVHNHPSGDPAPSAADIQITRQLRDASKTIEIEFLDHVILGTAQADPLGRGYYSFRETGLV